MNTVIPIARTAPYSLSRDLERTKFSKASIELYGSFERPLQLDQDLFFFRGVFFFKDCRSIGQNTLSH